MASTSLHTNTHVHAVNIGDCMTAPGGGGVGDFVDLISTMTSTQVDVDFRSKLRAPVTMWLLSEFGITALHFALAQEPWNRIRAASDLAMCSSTRGRNSECLPQADLIPCLSIFTISSTLYSNDSAIPAHLPFCNVYQLKQHTSTPHNSLRIVA